MIRRLTKFEFYGFKHPPRPPLHHLVVEEHEWYADDNKSLGVLFRDKIDSQWAYAVLAPDSESIYRWVDGSHSLGAAKAARDEFFLAMQRTAESKPRARPSGGGADANVSNSDPFAPVGPKDELHPSFKMLMEQQERSPARGMMREVFESFTDSDGNFIQQFQTAGFDARVWELYLHACLIDEGFNLEPSSRPDFVATKGGITVCIEAVTSNPTQGQRQSPEDLGQETLASFVEKEENFIPIKLGSALYSKLQKHYWELDRVRGRPFILAI